MTRSIKFLLSLTLTAALLTIGCIAFSGCGKDDKNTSSEDQASVESSAPAFFDLTYDEPDNYEKTEDKQETAPDVGDYTLRTYKFNGYYLAMYYFKDNVIDRIIGEDNLPSYEEKDINGQTFMVEKERRDTVGYAYAQHGNDVYVILYTDILYENDDTETIHANYDALLQSVRFTI